MKVIFDFWYLIGAAVSVVGVVEWLKGFFPATIPTKVWRAVLAVVYERMK